MDGDQHVHKMLFNSQKMAETGLNDQGNLPKNGPSSSPENGAKMCQMPGVGRLQCLRRAGWCTTSRSRGTRVRHSMGSGLDGSDDTMCDVNVENWSSQDISSCNLL